LREQFRMWAGNDVRSDELADAAGGIGTGVHGGFHAADVAFDDHGKECLRQSGFGCTSWTLAALAIASVASTLPT